MQYPINYLSQQYKRAPIPAVNKIHWFNCIHPSTYTTSSTSGASLFIPSPSYPHYLLFFIIYVIEAIWSNLLDAAVQRELGHIFLDSFVFCHWKYFPPVKPLKKLGKKSYALTFFSQFSRPFPGDQLKTLRNLNTEQVAFLTIFWAQFCENDSLILRRWLW